MKTQKLIPLLDYVLENKFPQTTEEAQSESILIDNFYNKVVNYAKFLSQPLKISMFVPCDENQVPLDKPSQKENWTSEGFGGYSMSIKELDEYQKAKSNVLFEGFEKAPNNLNPNSWHIWNKETSTAIVHYKSQPDYFIWNYKTIEELCKMGLTLTENAVKTING